MFELLLVTDRREAALPLPAAVEAALSAVPPGAAAVQLREKDLGGGALAEFGRALLPLCRARGAPLLVNDRIDLALALGLDGVHLAHSSVAPAEARRLLGPARLVGVSCHSEADVREATGWASYATFGPVFETPSKRAFGPPLGPAALARAARLGLPLFALGGVGPETAELLEAAAGVAAIRAALGGADPAGACAALYAAWSRGRARAQRPSSSGT